MYLELYYPTETNENGELNCFGAINKSAEGTKQRVSKFLKEKVFMKEVNEVVQKMSGGDVLVPVWTEFGDELELYHSTQPAKQLLYTVSVKLKRITITATTPSNSAVRFETGTSELVLSNRIANVQRR